MNLLLRALASAAAVAVAAWLLPGIRAPGGAPAVLVVAAVLGVVNALVRPVLKWLSCGLIVLTLGLFLVVINAAMLLLATYLTRAVGYQFYVDTFGSAVLGSLVISAVSFVLSMLLPDGD